MGIGDWGLGIGDWGLGPIPSPQSPIPNPQSPIPIDTYDIKFKIISYNQEKLIFGYYEILENCEQKDDELICHITKSILEKIIVKNGQSVKI